MSTRTPFDSEYTALVGTAVYVFAYYEWALIYMIQQFEPGFVHRYARGKPLTSGQVKAKLDAILSDETTSYSIVSRNELKDTSSLFGRMIDKRNALIHAHPVTDTDGSQILNYQARPDRPLPDMKWPSTSVEEAVREFDDAACRANDLLHRLMSAASPDA